MFPWSFGKNTLPSSKEALRKSQNLKIPRHSLGEGKNPAVAPSDGDLPTPR